MKEKKKYMYYIKYTYTENISYYNKYVREPVYVYVHPDALRYAKILKAIEFKCDEDCVDKAEALDYVLNEFVKRYYKHMYNIDIHHLRTSTRKKLLDEDKLNYVILFQPDISSKYQLKMRIFNEQSQMFLEDEEPKMYNQDYGEFKIDLVKWFYDTKLREERFRPAKELNHLECEELVKIFETLSDRENYVLIRRYFKNKDFSMNSYREIGEELGVTPERVRQIELRAIRKLKHPCRLRRFEYVFSTNKKELDEDYIKTMLSDGVTFSFNEVAIRTKRDIPIEEMNLSVRSYNCLKRSGILTSGDLFDKTELDLMRTRNLGKKSLKEVLDKRKELSESNNLETEYTYKYNYIDFTKLMLDICKMLEQRDEVFFSCRKYNNKEIDYYSNDRQQHKLFNFTIETYNKKDK